MPLTPERAATITDQRNAAMVAANAEAFLALWADDCVVEGPEHLLEGKGALRDAMEGAFAVMKPLEMVTRSLAVAGDAMFYEFAIVWENRASGERTLHTGMTYHQVDTQGHLVVCHEYFDPPGKPRPSAAEHPRIASLLVK